MNKNSNKYTTQLQAGLGLIEETKSLLRIYTPEMTASRLYDVALESGLFPTVSARRLRNIVAECFAPRYLKTDSAKYLARIVSAVPPDVFGSFLLVFTALANRILLDFIKDVYWIRYSVGRDTISTEDAKVFVVDAIKEGKTQKIWSENTIKKVSSYLIGCCADYGLLSSNKSSERRIQPVKLNDCVLLFFSYLLHFQGVGDNGIISHDIWKIFGLEPYDVREELKRLSKKNRLILQSAGNIAKISWKFNNMEEIVDVITEC